MFRVSLLIALFAPYAALRADEPGAVAELATEILAAPLPSKLTPTINLRGRIEADTIFVAQSAESQLLIGELENGYGFRRARIGVEGTLGSAATYVAEIDFAGSKLNIRDCFVGLTALPGPRSVHVGYFREPFSLEGATSSRFITFLERSPLNAFDPARSYGTAAYWWPESERLLYAIGAFRTGSISSGEGGDQDAWALTTRLTGLPLYDDSENRFRLVHVGGAFSFRSPLNGLVIYNPTPQSSLLTFEDSPPSPFLPTIDVAAVNQQLYNVQSAVVRGSLSLQSEWFGNVIQQPGAGPVFLHGFYVEASWFPTGEHRGYDRQRGAFDRVRVRKPVVREDGTRSDLGAIELTARYSFTDYASSNLPPPAAGPAFGTVLYETVFGVNWYLNDFVRLMANYTMAVPAIQTLPALPVHTFGFRAAIYW